MDWFTALILIWILIIAFLLRKYLHKWKIRGKDRLENEKLVSKHEIIDLDGVAREISRLRLLESKYKIAIHELDLEKMRNSELAEQVFTLKKEKEFWLEKYRESEESIGRKS